MSEALLTRARERMIARPPIPLDQVIEVEGLLRIAPLPPHARFVFRGRNETLLVAQKAFGLALPQKIGEAASAPPRHALKLGPDEWLLLAPREERLERGALVDVSSRDAVLAVEGLKAEDVLNAGCPLDLHPDVFPVQTCLRTHFAKAEILLWRTAPHAFQVAAQRSFARYLFALLREAAQEHQAA